MSFFKGKRDKAAPKNDEPVVVAVIANTVSSEIYQDILKQNGIKFICKQQGAGGYLKHIFGPLIIPDYIYVKNENYEQARQLYETYIETDGEIKILDSEEE